MGSNTSTEEGGKKSTYQKYQEKKRGPGPSDEDILKYTGKSRDELNTWAADRPNVAGNQVAGKIDMGAASGLGGAAAAGGYGGWGTEAGKGAKYPPAPKPAKKLDEEDSD